jgi:hypothetical protein
MSRTTVAAALALSFCAAAQADVTLHATSTGQGAGMSGQTSSVTYIKGLKMRIEASSAKFSTASIYDIDAQKLTILDTKKKEANVWDMGAFSQEMGKAVDAGGVQATMKPNGQVKAVNGQNADGYDVNIVVPATIGGSPVTMTLTGVSWIAKGVPGSAEYAAFYKAAGEKGWIFTDPRAAQGSPGQAKAMAQMYTEFAKIGGLPVLTEMSMTASGDGPVAAVMSRIGPITTNTVIETVETGALDDALFQVPADYTLKQR